MMKLFHSGATFQAVPESAGAMPLILVLVGLGLVLVLAYVILRGGKQFMEWRGTRLVRCPETCDYVAVTVDSAHAAATGLTHTPDLRLSSCTRWPERQDCGQDCLSQIQAAPEDCLVRSIAVRWFSAKQCVYCGRDLSEFRFHDYRCAMRMPDGVTLEWKDIAPEKLPGVLDRALPVCWNCHIAETFRRRHPELVTDRPGEAVGPVGGRSGNERG